jgi:hypothetical protein
MVSEPEPGELSGEGAPRLAKASAVDWARRRGQIAPTHAQVKRLQAWARTYGSTLEI